MSTREVKLNHSSAGVYFIDHDRGPPSQHSNVVLLLEFNRFLIPLTQFPSVVIRQDALDRPDTLRARGRQGLMRELVVASHGLGLCDRRDSHP
jgi:hypothetical protein